MFSRMRRDVWSPMAVLALVLAVWLVPAPSAFARGGGHGGGSGHGGGGHGGGGHHSGGHHSGGYHHGGYHRGGYYHGGYGYGGYGYTRYWPNLYLNWGGSYGYPGYGYGYGFGSGYTYPYYGYGSVYPNYSYGDAPVYTARGQGRYLGIDEQAVVDSGGRGMQVMRVYPGSVAEQAGLQVGDVIHSANGYLTQEHGNLTWIIAQAGPNGVLQLNVRTARDGADHVISTRVP